MSRERRVQLVYGNQHLKHLRDVLIPSLRTASAEPIHVRARNYCGTNGRSLESFDDGQIKLTDVPIVESRTMGFAENHNALFRTWGTPGDFVLLNPDCVMCDSSIDRLYERKTKCGSGTAIVEGRQWPFEHPKEYDPVSLETPWASDSVRAG